MGIGSTGKGAAPDIIYTHTQADRVNPGRATIEVKNMMHSLS